MQNLSPIKEEFLHYLWKTKKLSIGDCRDTQGKFIEIIDFGRHNLDSGPDFFNGKVKIENTVWAGNIEMHVYSSEWYRHKHHEDKAYENVILHVVYEHDKEIFRADGTMIPTLELKGKIPGIYLQNYLKLSQSNEKIPCAYAIQNVDKAKTELWKYTLVAERLQRKTAWIDEILKSNNQDWEETFYIVLSRYFGSKVNTEPFEQLARSTPLNLLRKNKDNSNILEAILFGQAGMLEANYKDDYYRELKREYQYQQKKYGLHFIPSVMWKFSKMRPANFPTLRIAQLAAFLCQNDSLFQQIKQFNTVRQIREIFRKTPHPYWEKHYRFDYPAGKKQSSVITDSFMDILLINAVAPMIFHYGKSTDDLLYTDRAFTLLEQISSEHNSIIDTWQNLGLRSEKAFDSQALLQLRSEYCNKKRCLECSIGNEILGKQ